MFFFIPNIASNYMSQLFWGNSPVTDWGTRWCSWLRHYATSRKVAGSIPDGIIGIFH